jgi:two-component system, OmpR family, KDP operon response regulator KdpE
MQFSVPPHPGREMAAVDPPSTALLIEDEERIRRFLRTALEREGWVVREARTLHQGLEDARAHQPDLVILDLGLPDGDGMDFLRDLRDRSTLPVIVLSARASEHDKIKALDAGANDYLTKPFGVAELLARVRAAVRRYRQIGGGVVKPFEFGDVCIDWNARTISKGGVPVHLTPIEYRLLCLLIANEGNVLTHRRILSEIWGAQHSGDAHYLRVYMGHLRQKLEADPAQPEHILTETAVGYRLVQNPTG